MTTYNTGNPLGSASAKDLYDNAENLDHYENDMQNETWPDRFGRQRLTRYGQEKMNHDAISQYGYITVDSFQEGANITLPNQALRNTATGEYYRWDGSLPKTVPAGSTPQSSGGVGLGAWVSVGDASLRGQLEQPTGATVIGAKNTTGSASNVQQELTARDSASYRDRCIKKLAAVDYLVRSKGSFKVLCQGDSLTAGFDRSTTDVVPPENGDRASHATTNYPQRLASFIQEQSGATATPVIRAISGYTAKEAFENPDWQTNPNCDIAFIMYGVNDAGDTPTPEKHAAYVDYMERFIKRFIDWGMGVVVIAPAVGSYGSIFEDAQKYARQIKNMATVYGCAWFDGNEVHNNKIFSSIISDGIHFNSQGYALLGEAIASMMMGGGLLPSYRPISSEFTTWPGQSSDHVGYYNPRGTVTLNRNQAAYTLQKISGGLPANTASVASFSFYLDAEVAEIDIVGSWNAGSFLQCAVSPTTASKAGVNVPYYDPAGRSTNLAEPVTGTKYVSSINNVNTASGAPKHVATISGRGWKTVTFYNSLDGSSTADSFIQAMTIRPVPRYLASRKSSGSLRRGIKEVNAVSIPARDFYSSSGTPSTKLLTAVLPLPFDLYGVAYNAADQFYDCGFAKIYISGYHQNNAPVYYEAIIQRSSGGNSYTVNVIRTFGLIGTVSAICGTKPRKTVYAQNSVAQAMPLEAITDVGDDSSFTPGGVPNEFGLFLQLNIDWGAVSVPSGWYTVYVESFARGIGGAASVMGGA